VKAKAERKKAPLSERARREALSWLWVILAFVLIEGTLVQARVIPSGSMEKTVLIGDHLIVSRLGYDAGVPFTNWNTPLWRSPKRQQIIVFRPPFPSSSDYIKRCIGIPGDVLEIRKGIVWVNGKPLDEPYRNGPPNSGENHGPITVPAGKYFMMGDNRDDSYDSRMWGFVPRANIVGTPLVIYMSIDAGEEVWEPGHLGERFATYLRVVVHPSEVRWKRLFQTF
jgi:signal peptidase I